MNTTPATEKLLEPPSPHWVSRAAFPILAAVFFLNQAALGAAVYLGSIWIVVPLALTASHLMHGLLIGFHEASHGLLRKTRRLNEIDGVIIGIFSLTSFSLYRAAHQLHHAYLATERDVELWPFVIPGMPRWVRVIAAALELGLGLFYTPFIVYPHFSPSWLAHSKQKAPAANLGGVGADDRRLGLSAGCGGLVGCMEVFSLDVPGACISGFEHAELAQVHRARGAHWLHGEQFYEKHCF